MAVDKPNPVLEEEPLEVPLEDPPEELEDQVEDEVEAEVEEDLTITLGDDAVEDEDEDLDEELGEKGRRALKRLRELAAEKSREARVATARLAQLEAGSTPNTAMPKKPTFEECGFDEAVYDKQIEEWVLAKAEAEKRAATQEAERQKGEQDYNDRLKRYTESKQVLRVPDYEEAEDVVRRSLSTQQQAIIIRNAAEPEKFVYALGRSKKALGELASIMDLDRFAYRVAKLEGEIVVKKKGPPPVESRLPGGSAATVGTGSLKNQLAAAEKDAERTGDRSKVIAIKRQMQQAQQQAR
jgi:hypothetical protein